MRDFDLRHIESLVSGEFPAQVSAWLATYLVHGLCLFAIAALGTRVIKSVRGVEQLWRAALFGPLVTASLQLGAGFSPALGHWELPGSEVRTVTIDAAAPASIAAEPRSYEEREALHLARLEQLSGDLAQLSTVEEQPTSPASAAETAYQARFTRRGWGATIGLWAVAAGIAVLMLRALLEAIRMHSLGRHARLMSGPVIDAVDTLRQRAGIRRSIRVEVAEQGSSPYATGLLFPRIVLPRRALTELNGPSLQAMLAHEMGHVARLDPLWTAAARSVAALFFFSPLNWFLVRRLEITAEYCCDEFAVNATGNEVALARCLTAVAEWIMGPSHAGQVEARPACPMAHRNSPLKYRVNRILDTDGLPAKPLGLLRWVGAAVVLTTAMAAPGFAAKQTGPIPLEAAYVLEEPVSPIAALSSSIEQLQGDIQTLIVLAAEREVPHATIRRLTRLHVRAIQVRSIAERLKSRLPQSKH